MIIDRNISDYIVFSEDCISNALKKIGQNKHRFIIAVSQSSRLEGIITDGDFRRWLLKQTSISLDCRINDIINRDCIFANISDSPSSIRNLLSEKIHAVPLLDLQRRLVAIARKREPDLVIGPYRLAPDAPAVIIAEIGNNHNGDLFRAKQLIDSAIAAGADFVKFQMRHLEDLYRNRGMADDRSADLGAQYTLDLLSKYQLPKEDMFRAFDYCLKHGIQPLCTPFDLASLTSLEEYGMVGYKLASADLTNHELLLALTQTGKPLICSTGMSTEQEIEKAIELLKSSGTQFVLLLCNSTYPAPFKDINLSYMDRLKALGDCLVGYSSHERGISVPIAAISLGAKVIEKHLTLDRSLEGNDHKVSILPNEFKLMVQSIREVEQALGSGGGKDISQGEMMNREILGKSLQINTDLAPGDIIRSEMIETKSPGCGLPPYRKSELVGKRAQHFFSKGDFFFASDIDGATAEPQKYHFHRPFGIPVRYHDFHEMVSLSNFDLIEFHLSYKDMSIQIEDIFSTQYDLDFLVHSPELFAGDHILDLCSFDERYRHASIKELQKVIDITRKINKFFPKTHNPRIIVNVGGSTQDAHIEPDQREKYYQLFRESLEELDDVGVELIPQTMPPFPWHFGGQRFQNIFMEPNEIAFFCNENNMRICLDISHSKLACNYFKWSFDEFIQTVGPYTAHIHIVDADGFDSEGLQIGEGSIDFRSLGKNLQLFAPGASFIPEIWQGHKNRGEGFWLALEKLEHWMPPTTE